MKVKKIILEHAQSQQRSENVNLFNEELKAIYESEKQLNLTLPKMILDAETPEIADGLVVHLKFTQEHLLRLETFFKSINEPLIP